MTNNHESKIFLIILVLLMTFCFASFMNVADADYNQAAHDLLCIGGHVKKGC